MGKPLPSYEANISLELEQGDPLPIAGDQASWNDFIAKHEPVAIYSFAFMPFQSEDQVVFRSAQLQIKGQPPLEFLSSNAESVVSTAFNLKAAVLRRP